MVIRRTVVRSGDQTAREQPVVEGAQKLVEEQRSLVVRSRALEMPVLCLRINQQKLLTILIVQLPL